MDHADMSQLFRLTGAVRRDPAIGSWLDENEAELGAIARRWFEVMRDSGDDVREVLNDDQPTVCVDDAAFGYVNVFKAHVNVGFFRSAGIADPDGPLAIARRPPISNSETLPWAGCSELECARQGVIRIRSLPLRGLR